eukprot:TRINITY_DN12520_c1_g7_i1.p1 TRINITY_DN12520_c1_g7~~TRINITY_DN12520_c1_g7_i1.p1  ORF type:complete len:953 (+),score=231.79 TRINITY_DN12520_c1_g7_i1:74-2932(+)
MASLDVDVTLSDISAAIKELQAAWLAKGGAEAITEQNTDALVLCSRLDLLLADGLEKKYQKHDSYWAYAKCFCRKDMIQTISHLTAVKTGRGRARAWLRLALNESSLESYLNLFMVDDSYKSKYYSKSAWMYRLESLELIAMLVSGLEMITFDLELDVSSLDPMKGPGGVITADKHPTARATHRLSSADTRARTASLTTPEQAAAAEPIAVVARTEVLTTRKVKKKKKKRKVDVDTMTPDGTLQHDSNDNDDTAGDKDDKTCDNNHDEDQQPTADGTAAQTEETLESRRPMEAASLSASVHVARSPVSQAPAHDVHDPTFAPAADGVEQPVTDNHNKHGKRDKVEPTDTTDTITGEEYDASIVSDDASEIDADNWVDALPPPEEVPVLEADADNSDPILHELAAMEQEAAEAQALQAAEAQQASAFEAEMAAALAPPSVTSQEQNGQDGDNERTDASGVTSIRASRIETPDSSVQALLHDALGSPTVPELPIVRDDNEDHEDRDNDNNDHDTHGKDESITNDNESADANENDAGEQAVKSCAALVSSSDDQSLYLYIHMQLIGEEEKVLHVLMLRLFDGPLERRCWLCITSSHLHVIMDGINKAVADYSTLHSILLPTLKSITRHADNQGLVLSWRDAILESGSCSLLLMTGDVAATDLIVTSCLQACKQAGIAPPPVPPVNVIHKAAVAAFLDEHDKLLEVAGYRTCYAILDNNSAAKLQRSLVIKRESVLVKKEGLVSTSWKKYTFVLRGTQLIQMSSSNDKVAKATFDVRAPTFTCAPVAESDHSYAFACGPASEPLVLAPTSRAAALSWLRCLTQDPHAFLDNGTIHLNAHPDKVIMAASLLVTKDELMLCIENHSSNHFEVVRDEDIEDLDRVRDDGSHGLTLIFEGGDNDDDSDSEADDHDGFDHNPQNSIQLLFATTEAREAAFELLDQLYRDTYEVGLKRTPSN